MYRPVLVTPPTTAPVSLEAAVAHSRVDSEDEDGLVEDLIAAAISYLDGWTGILGRAIFTQTWRQDFDGFASCLRLPLFPVASITSVKYIDTSDVEQTVSSSNYVLRHDETGAFVLFDVDYAFPSVTDENGPRVNVTYVAGEASPPPAIKQAILLLVGHWYEERSTVGTVTAEIAFTVNALVAPFRRIKF